MPVRKLLIIFVSLFFGILSARAEEKTQNLPAERLIEEFSKRALEPYHYRIFFASVDNERIYIYQVPSGFYVAYDKTREVQKVEGHGGTDWAHLIQRYDSNEHKELLREIYYGLELKSETAEMIDLNLHASCGEGMCSEKNLSLLINPRVDVDEAKVISEYSFKGSKSAVGAVELFISIPVITALPGQVLLLPAFLLSKVGINSYEVGDSLRGIAWGTSIAASFFVAGKLRSMQKRGQIILMTQPNSAAPDDATRSFVGRGVIASALVGNAVGTCAWLLSLAHGL